MHSDLLDEHGRKRAGIFYKAAFYDRHAHMSMTPRYWINAYQSCDATGNANDLDDNATHSRVDLMDGDTVLRHFGVWRDGDYDQKKQLEASARAYIGTYRPQWQSALAYWNEPEPEHV
jgi:hypothetical protein